MPTTLRPDEFYGQNWTRHILPGFELMEAVYPPERELPKHSHECACFSVMLRGRMKENYGSHTLESYAQTIGFNAADEPHSNAISSSGARVLILQLGIEQTRRAQQYSPRFNTSAVFNHGELSWLGPEAVPGGRAKRLRLAVGDRGARARNDCHPVPVDRTSPNSVAAVAYASARSPVRSICGILEKARSLLLSTASSLAEIATLSGFCDQAHLSHVFKRHVGMSPGQYRRTFWPRGGGQEPDG